MNNNSTNPIDIEAIRIQAKQRWIKENRKTYSFLDLVERSVPWWLVLIAAVLYALSAPHTAAVFGQLTPVFGWFAPLAVEFGLLYASFRRKRAKQSGEALPKAIWLLEILLFATAILVNGAGSFQAVVSVVGLRDLPLSEIFAKFATFPGTTQIALVLVPLAAFIIPIGTGVAGEGLAALVFERDRSRDELEARWATDERIVVYRAVYTELIKRQMPIIDARKQAASLSAGLSAGHPRTVSRTAENEPPSEIRLIPERTFRATSKLKQKGSDPDARSKVQAYLDEHPEAVSMSVRDLASVVGCGRTVAAEEKAKWKMEHGQ